MSSPLHSKSWCVVAYTWTCVPFWSALTVDLTQPESSEEEASTEGVPRSDLSGVVLLTDITGLVGGTIAKAHGTQVHKKGSRAETSNNTP